MLPHLAWFIAVSSIAPSSGAAPALLSRSLRLAMNSSNLDESKVNSANDPEQKPDYNEETPLHKMAPAIWPKRSSIPVTVEIIIAFFWIGLVSCVPMFLRIFTGHKSTRTDTTLCICLWICLYGGLYLFTNIILFQSYHFDSVRTLTVVECVYLMSQIVTTVGYGDITPAKPRGQVFVGLYVIGSFLVIAVLVSDLCGRIIEVAQGTIRKRRGHGATSKEAKDDEAARNWQRQRPQPNAMRLTEAFIVYGSLCATWVIFFYSYPGENKTLMECIYMSIITLSTVGFGAFTPQTEAGKVFAAFWMVFGSVAMVAVISEFTQWVSEVRAYENYSEQVNEEVIEELKSNSSKAKMSEAEFYCFYLAHKGYANEDRMQMFRKAFTSMSDQEGRASTKTIIEQVWSKSK